MSEAVTALVEAEVLGFGRPEPLTRYPLRTSTIGARDATQIGDADYMAEPTREELARPVQVGFAHAVLQDLASEAGVEVLHIKGPAIDPSLAGGSARGTDADVLVRPSHLGRLVGAMQQHGWAVHLSAEAGSPFGHATTLVHPMWGYADVHRLFPGITIDPEDAFDRLWARRSTTSIAEIDCTVPSLDDQRTLLVLNAARASPTRPMTSSGSGPLPPTSSAPPCASGPHGSGPRSPSPPPSESSTCTVATRSMRSGRSRPRAAPAPRSGLRACGPNRRRSARFESPHEHHAANREQLALHLGHQPSLSEQSAAIGARAARAVREMLDAVMRLAGAGRDRS